MKNPLPIINYLLSKSFLVFFTLLSLIATLATPTQVNATNQPDFKTHIHSTYVVNDLGSTTVSHDFTITNLTPSRYISKYAIQTSYPVLTNVTVTNNNKDIEANVVSHNNVTSIAAEFPDQVVGQSKQRIFTISYQTPDIAIIAGKVLEINIPRLSQQNENTTHDVEIITPKKFGSPIRMNPSRYQLNETEQTFITTYNSLGTQPISGIFGRDQIFSLNLRYHLENLSSSTGKVQIAIPPDTSYQKMRYHSIEPPTKELKRDSDGNWIATYEVPAQTTTTVNLVADVQLTLDPLPDYVVPVPTEQHITPLEYWQLDKESNQILTQLDDAKSINDLVTQSLTYNYSLTDQPITRWGASEILAEPDQAMCQEFTDLFIALARAKKIPARRVTGYAYTQNNQLRPLSLEGDVLHAWPEFYDASQRYWHSIDPTWQHTTGGIDYFSQFDLNHVTFAINGVDSSKPYPAGSYKANQVETKDIEVTFAETFPPSQPDISITYVPTRLLGISIPGVYTIQLSNNTGEAWYNSTITQLSNDPDITLSPSEIPLPVLLPYEDTEIAIQVFSDSSWSFDTTEIIATLQTHADQPINSQVTVQSLPQTLKLLTNEKNLIILVITIVLITLTTGSVLVFRQRQ